MIPQWRSRDDHNRLMTFFFNLKNPQFNNLKKKKLFLSLNWEIENLEFEFIFCCCCLSSSDSVDWLSVQAVAGRQVYHQSSRSGSFFYSVLRSAAKEQGEEKRRDSAAHSHLTLRTGAVEERVGGGGPRRTTWTWWLTQATKLARYGCQRRGLLLQLQLGYNRLSQWHLQGNWWVGV